MPAAPGPTRSRRRFVAGIAAFAHAPLGWTQQRSAAPLRIIVAGPPGGGADFAARLLVDGFAADWGRPVVVDNRPGGAGMIALGELHNSPRDGTVLLLGVNALVTEIPHIVATRRDAQRDIVPIAEVMHLSLLLVANPGLPVDDVKSLVAYARARPGTLSFASYTPGTISHVLGLVLNHSAGLDMAHVGYRGSPQALADVMANHVPLMFDGIVTALPLVKGGRLRALAVTSERRNAQLPLVATVREQGFPELEATGWQGLWCAPGVPADIQARARATVLRVLADPAVRRQITERGMDPGYRDLPAVAASLHADSERIGSVLRSIGFKPSPGEAGR